MTRLLLWLCLIVLSIVPGIVRGQTSDADRIRSDVEALTREGHRLSGSDAGRAAGDYILAQLQKAGVERVIVQPFPVVQIHRELGDCYLLVAGRPIPVEPLRPNGLALPVTPSNGLSAEAVYLGSADDDAWRRVCSPGGTLAGKIAVLNDASGETWIRAVELGARAVIFLDPTSSNGSSAPFVRAHANIPRFFLSRAAATEAGLLGPGATPVVLHARMSYRIGEARNIIAFSPGAAGEDLTTVAVDYDTFGPVPFQSPSPKKAANVAGLLELARRWQREPPARSRAMIFFDNGAQEQSGQMWFQYALQRGSGPANEMGSIRRALQGLDAEERSVSRSLREMSDLQRLLGTDENTPSSSTWPLSLLTRLLAATAIALVVWMCVDVWHVAGGANVRFAMVGRFAVTVILIIGLLLFTKNQGENSRQSQSERAAFLEFVRSEHDRQVELLTSFRLEAVNHQSAKPGDASDTSGDSGARSKEKITEAVDGHADTSHGQRDASDSNALDVLRVKIKSAEENLKRLSAARLDATRGIIREETRATLESLRLSRRNGLVKRAGEIDAERRRLNASLNVTEAFKSKRMQAALFVDLAPRPGSWAVDVPSAAPMGVGARWTSHPSLTRWMSSWAASSDGRKACASLAGVLTGTAPRSPGDWSVWAQAGFVVQAIDPGARWPGESSPTEAPADASAMAVKLDEVDRFLAAMESSGVMGKSRPPSRVPTYYFNMPSWDELAGRRQGCTVREDRSGAIESGSPVAGAIIESTPRQSLPARDTRTDRLGGRLFTSDATGAFPLLADDDRRVVLTAVACDDQGAIRSISQLRPGGSEAGPGTWDRAGFHSAQVPNRLSLFEAQSIVLTSVRDRAFLNQSSAAGLRLFRGATDAAFPKLHLSFDAGVASGWVDRVGQFKAINRSEVALGNQTGDMRGQGYTADQTLNMTTASAGDLWRLNESRLAALRDRGVVLESAERAHDQAARLLADAEQASNDPSLRLAKLEASQGYSAQVYEPARLAATDMVRAVVLLLLLAIPFAWAVERMLIAAVNIYKQIAGFGAIFLTVFVTLYLVHPAFAFTSFPVVVLLAFLLIVLSGVVIAMTWGKFEYEVKKLQGLAIASHSSTRNARSTMSAAFGLGVASMRRRPLRTALTAVTIVLLTFAVMVFGSLSTGAGVRRVFQGPGDGAARVEVQLSGAKRLPLWSAAAIRRLAGENATFSVGRSAQQAVGGDTSLVSATGAIVPVRSWIALDKADFEASSTLRASIDLNPNEFFHDGGLLLPRSLHGMAKPGDRVDFLGRSWIVRGTFDSAVLRTATTPGGLRFVPPDIAEMRRIVENQNPGDPETVQRVLDQTPTSSYPMIEADSLVILSDPVSHPVDDVSWLSIALGTDAAGAGALAEDLAIILQEPVTLIAGGRIDRVVYATRVEVGGLTTLLPPLLLGGLIILGTMLSSVTDREREIYTLAALGLSPTHVGILFFAEALVYSLLGSLSGYLVGQVFSRVGDALAARGWPQPPHVNASSTDAMLAILLVMATVLISTIYPAIKASRSANPGAQRRWRLSEPVGDRHDVEFPFTVSRDDAIGLMAFLEEHLSAHRDRAAGSFAAGDVEIEHREGRFVLRTRIWLQPFDQGVSQRFELATETSDIEGVDRVLLRMERLSGPPAVWRRGNVVFVDDLRRQFLFFRTIDADAAEHYYQRSVEMFGFKQG